MPLFDRYIAVDWSAANTPKRGKDSIWIGELGPEGRVPSDNPATRHAAMAEISGRLLAARQRGERVMLGFDFVFGYPRGAAAAIAGGADWQALWRYLAAEVTDTADNSSNRFQLAEAINHRLADGPHFWGHPHQHSYAALHPKRPVAAYATIPERRAAERYIRSAQPVWKLTGVGSVGSQAMLGIARLAALRSDPRFADEIAVWPFETGFADDLNKPIIVTEIYPSLFPVTAADGLPRDRAQVEACVVRFAELDAAGMLVDILAAPPGLSDRDREEILAEEGWIAGVGREGIIQAPFTDAPPVTVPAVPPPPHYLSDPDAIYAQSFATIRAEADLSSFPAALRPVAIRMIHACGMVDLAADIVGDRAVVTAARKAIAMHMPILCDSAMVAAGIATRNLTGNDIIMKLDDPAIPDLAQALGTTRSAAAVEFWRQHLAGAVVVIGNAPTALFHLLDLLAAGAPRPAAIIAMPVGFVGAAEIKARLIAEAPVPFITVTGRRGGSAIASAAFNAIAAGA